MVAAIAVATSPPELENQAGLPKIPDNPANWIAQEIAGKSNQFVVPGAEKRITWFQGNENSRAEFAVIYLHGFSATRQELSPVPELLATKLQANLFETRLHGHGLSQQPLSSSRAEYWIQDAAESLAVGLAIGKKLIVMGTSTGATLALTLLDFPESEHISSFVLLAPNFGTADRNSEFLTWPGGLQLAKFIIGDHHSWEPANEQQAKYWATDYPVEALVEMMRVVKHVRGQLPLHTNAKLLVVYSPRDTVIDIEQLRDSYELINSPKKSMVALPDENHPTNPGMHILAGDIMAPQNNQLLLNLILSQ